MDNFFRRLKYYGIGFGIGLIFVVFFFGNRGCAWYPENRVKNTIFNRILVVSDNEMVKLKDLGLTKKDLILAINEGDVDFKKSKKNNHFKVYRFTCETKSGKTFNCNVTLNEDSFISEVQFGDKSAFKVKNTKEGLGSFIYFPKEKDFVFMDTTDLILCQQEAIKLVNENKLFNQIRKTGKLNFEKSNLSIQPKPEHWIQFRDKKNRLIEANAIWYKEKIEINRFVLPFKVDCK
jgi:hypothetical protein